MSRCCLFVSFLILSLVQNYFPNNLDYTLSPWELFREPGNYLETITLPKEANGKQEEEANGTFSIYLIISILLITEN